MRQKLEEDKVTVDGVSERRELSGHSDDPTEEEEGSSDSASSSDGDEKILELLKDESKRDRSRLKEKYKRSRRKVQSAKESLTLLKNQLELDSVIANIEASKSLVALKQRLEEAELEVNRCEEELQGLLIQRSQRVVAALTQINGTLSSTYPLLSGSYNGEALFQYSEDPDALFSGEGIKLIVKPEENSAWTALDRLSLGQQSQVLACLSLSCNIGMGCQNKRSAAPLVCFDEVRLFGSTVQNFIL